MMTVYVCHACSGMKPMPGPRPGHPCTVLDIINFARAFIHDHRDCAIVQARKAGHYTDVFDPEGADG